MNLGTVGSWVLRGGLVLALGGGVAAWRQRPREVLRATVDRGDVRLEATGTGTVEPDQRVAVAFTVTGRITTLAVDEGMTVRAGQTLATLDAADTERRVRLTRASESLAAVSVERAEADVARAEAVLDAAQSDLARTRTLSQSEAVSTAALEAARERAARAEADLRAARAARAQAGAGISVARATTSAESRRLEDARVVSPFDGVVPQRLHSVGDVVPPGTPVLVIASTAKVRVRAWIDETALPALQDGGEARVVLRSEPEHPVRGRIERVGLEADRQSHEVLVDVELLERPARYAFGQRADVFLTLAARTSVTRAPVRFCDVASASCLVQRADRVQRATVTFGLVGNELLEVTSGLRPGDVLLVPPETGGALRVGDRVRGSRGS